MIMVMFWQLTILAKWKEQLVVKEVLPHPHFKCFFYDILTVNTKTCDAQDNITRLKYLADCSKYCNCYEEASRDSELE